MTNTRLGRKALMLIMWVPSVVFRCSKKFRLISGFLVPTSIHYTLRVLHSSSFEKFAQPSRTCTALTYADYDTFCSRGHRPLRRRRPFRRLPIRRDLRCATDGHRARRSVPGSQNHLSRPRFLGPFLSSSMRCASNSPLGPTLDSSLSSYQLASERLRR